MWPAKEWVFGVTGWVVVLVAVMVGLFVGVVTLVLRVLALLWWVWWWPCLLWLQPGMLLAFVLARQFAVAQATTVSCKYRSNT